MFGTNPIRKPERDVPDGTIAVQEIFYTIQGEGPFSGRPAVFIRLAGCHLACTFCDTEFESGINNRWLPAAVAERAVAVVRELQPLTLKPLPLVVVTGGEPFRQSLASLLLALQMEGFPHVQFETAGNLWDQGAAPFLTSGFASLVVSPKTAHVHWHIAKYAKHWKYIVDSTYGVCPGDGLPIGPTQAEQPATTRVYRPWERDAFYNMYEDTIWISPCDSHDAAKNKANVELATATCMRYGYRLSLQTHKLVGLP